MVQHSEAGAVSSMAEVCLLGSTLKGGVKAGEGAGVEAVAGEGQNLFLKDLRKLAKRAGRLVASSQSSLPLIDHWVPH